MSFVMSGREERDFERGRMKSVGGNDFQLCLSFFSRVVIDYSCNLRRMKWRRFSKGKALLFRLIFTSSLSMLRTIDLMCHGQILLVYLDVECVHSMWHCERRMMASGMTFVWRAGRVEAEVNCVR